MNEKSAMELIIYALKGIIAEAPPDKRQKFEECTKELQQIIEKNGEIGEVAATLLGLEYMKKNI